MKFYGIYPLVVTSITNCTISMLLMEKLTISTGQFSTAIFKYQKVSGSKKNKYLKIAETGPPAGMMKALVRSDYILAFLAQFQPF